MKQHMEEKNNFFQENTKTFHEYKCRQTCKRCGARASVEPEEFKFFELYLPRKLSTLVRKLNPEHFIAELEKRDLFCGRCYRFIYNKSVRKIG
jgi:hypothetical protein